MVYEQFSQKEFHFKGIRTIICWCTKALVADTVEIIYVYIIIFILYLEELFFTFIIFNNIHVQQFTPKNAVDIVIPLLSDAG